MWFWFFIISTVVNLLLLFYVRWLVKTIAVINEDVENVSDLIKEFSTHTKQVYELEMFYGDDTLKSLMEHASKLSEKLSDLDLILNNEEENNAEEATPPPPKVQ